MTLRATTRRAHRFMIAMLVLAVFPLATSVFLFGHRSWTSQWAEIAVALGWSTPKYPWVEDIQQHRFKESERPSLDWQKFYLRTSDDPATRAAQLHGLWLILRERSSPFGHDPMHLLWSSQLSERGRQLLCQGSDVQRFGPQLRSAMNDLPLDHVLQAELMCGVLQTENLAGSEDSFSWLAADFYDPNRLKSIADSQKQTSSSEDSSDISAGPPLNLWQGLAYAARVLRESAGAKYPHVFVGLMQRGNVCAMYARLPLHSNAPFEKWGTAEYARAIELLSQARADEYLEKSLEHRVARAWESLGLEPRMAQFAARNDRSISALAVGEHVAQHLELLPKLAEQAIQHGDLDRAARWIELSESAGDVFEQSVRSPWLHNYIRKQHGLTGSLAQVVQVHADCPPDVAARMAGVVARNKGPLVRAVSRHNEPFVAFFLDNVARSSLRISAWTLIVAAIGTVCLRARDGEWLSAFQLAAVRGTKRVAAAALLLVAAVFVGLEATNALGERAAGVFYAFTFSVILLAMIARIGWLIVAEVVRDPDPQRQRLRRRVIWLVACGAMFVAMRPLVGGHNMPFDPNSWLAELEPVTSDAGLSAALRLFFGTLFVLTAIGYALLRWRQSRNEPTPPAIHPLLIAVAAIWFGLWIVLGPPGAWLRGQKSWFMNVGGDWSEAMAAVDQVAAILEVPFSASPSFRRGWNPLTFGVALRMINAGLWLAVACQMLWLVVVYPPRWFTRIAAAERTAQSRGEIKSQCFMGITGSCLWLGLLGLLFHAWATLGMGYFVNRVLQTNG